jgi:hypothetical protein
VVYGGRAACRGGRSTDGGGWRVEAAGQRADWAARTGGCTGMFRVPGTKSYLVAPSIFVGTYIHWLINEYNGIR